MNTVTMGFAGFTFLLTVPFVFTSEPATTAEEPCQTCRGQEHYETFLDNSREPFLLFDTATGAVYKQVASDWRKIVDPLPQSCYKLFLSERGALQFLCDTRTGEVFRNIGSGWVSRINPVKVAKGEEEE